MAVVARRREWRSPVADAPCRRSAQHSGHLAASVDGGDAVGAGGFVSVKDDAARERVAILVNAPGFRVTGSTRRNICIRMPAGWR